MFSTFWDAKTARVLFTILTFVLFLSFLRGARATLTLFLFAILFAYFVEPLVAFLQTPLRGRIKAIVATYLLLSGIACGLGFLLGPRIAEEGKALMTSLPALADHMTSGQFIFRVGRSQGWTQERQIQIQHFFMSHRDSVLRYGEGLAGDLEAPLTHIWWLILIPILSLFFLKDGRSIAAGMVRLGGDQRKRAVIEGIVNDVNVMLGSYIRAQIILAALTAIVLTIVLGSVRVPFAFILGPLAGVFEFIPVVGPAVACALIFGLALLAGYGHLLFLFLFLGTWRIIQDYLNAPRVMGKQLEISPLAEIFGVLAGGEIGGVVGALVSVPVLAVLRILWIRLSDTEGVKAPASAVVQRSSHTSHGG